MGDFDERPTRDDEPSAAAERLVSDGSSVVFDADALALAETQSPVTTPDEEDIVAYEDAKSPDTGAAAQRGRREDAGTGEEDAPLLSGMVDEGRRRGSVDPALPSPRLQRFDYDDESLSPLQRGGSLISAIANMSNAILCVGAIGLPYALRQSGLVTGLVLLIGLGVLTDWTIRLLPLLSKLTSRNSYIGIMDECFGPAGRAACTIAQFSFAFGGCVAFSLIVGDSLPHVLSSFLPDRLADTPFFTFLFSRPVVIIVFISGVAYPLSLYRDIEKLSKASALALVSMVTILIAVATQGPRLPGELRGSASAFTIVDSGVASAIGVISFALAITLTGSLSPQHLFAHSSCHRLTNSVLIFGSLNQPTLDRFNRVTHVSMTFAVSASTAMALAGYLVFTDKTPGNVLNAFPPDMVVINIARGCFGLNMFTTLPLEAFVCRESIEAFFFADRPFDARRHVMITTAIVGAAMLISLLLTDLGPVLELTGGIAATFLAFVMPAGAYLRVSRRDADHRLLAWAVVGFGALVAVLVPLQLVLRR